MRCCLLAKELLKHPCPPESLFADIAEFFTEEARSDISRAQKTGTVTLDILLHLLKVKGGCVVDTARCIKNNKMSKFLKALLHIAGPPCVSWSSMGKRKTTSGADVIHFLAWAAMRLLIKDDTFIFEHVHSHSARSAHTLCL
jgi:hypothetical protein